MRTTTSPRLPLRPARATIRHDAPLRRDRRAAAAWALAHGRPLDLDALTVLLAVVEESARIEQRPADRWTPNTVLNLLFGAAVEWCRRQSVELPASMGESLYTYLRFLHDRQRFGDGSAPITELCTTTIELAGLTGDGRIRHRSPTFRTNPGTLAGSRAAHPGGSNLRQLRI